MSLVVQCLGKADSAETAEHVLCEAGLGSLKCCDQFSKEEPIQRVNGNARFLFVTVPRSARKVEAASNSDKFGSGQ